MKKWEVTISEFESEKGKIFKVTRRYPELLVAETRVFNNKKEALELFYEWLNQ